MNKGKDSALCYRKVKKDPSLRLQWEFFASSLHKVSDQHLEPQHLTEITLKAVER